MVEDSKKFSAVAQDFKADCDALVAENVKEVHRKMHGYSKTMLVMSNFIAAHLVHGVPRSCLNFTHTQIRSLCV